MLVSEMKRSPCSFHDSPSIPRVKKAQPSLAQWRPGHAVPLWTRAAVRGRNSAARARGGSAREPLRRRMRASAWASHTLWVYASPRSSSFWWEKTTALEEGIFFFSCSKTAAVQEIKDLNTMTKLFCSWVFELLTFKWLNFYKVRFLTAFIHSVFLKDMRTARVQTLTETEEMII